MMPHPPFGTDVSEAETTWSHFAKSSYLHSGSCLFRCENLYEELTCTPRCCDASEKPAYARPDRDSVAVPWINGRPPHGDGAAGRSTGGRGHVFRTVMYRPPTPATDAHSRQTLPGQGLRGGGFVVDQLFLPSNEEIFDRRRLGLVLDQFVRPMKLSRAHRESVSEESRSDDSQSGDRLVLPSAVEPARLEGHRLSPLSKLPSPDLPLPRSSPGSEVQPLPVPPTPAETTWAPAAFAVALEHALAALAVAGGEAIVAPASGAEGAASLHEWTKAVRALPISCPWGLDSRLKLALQASNTVLAVEDAELIVSDKTDGQFFLPMFPAPADETDIADPCPSSDTIINRSGTVIWSERSKSSSKALDVFATNCTNESDGSLREEFDILDDGGSPRSTGDTLARKIQAPLCCTYRLEEPFQAGSAPLENAQRGSEGDLSYREAIFDEAFLSEPMVKFPVAVELQTGTRFGPSRLSQSVSDGSSIVQHDKA
eukprot:TRINITY_DN73950_c0_g1_i1.p1 TRINITY_DN73950_c0_g1~~TRINITY_DN73950_c0_g1_i1.p1  ORF type:complete len:485 (-),score=66.94 TRINITY_DN73950_c0_g1_i1:76-1530(-)